MNGFLYWNKNLVIEYYPNNLILLSINNESQNEKDNEVRKEILKEKMSKFEINSVATNIFLAFDGTLKYKDVIDKLSNSYQDFPDNVQRIINGFLEDINKKYGIYLVEQTDQFKHAVIEIKKKNIYPRVASIEITNNCNLRCKHCYGNYGEIQKKLLKFNQLTKLLLDMKDVGVKIVEFTGGEATTHPEIENILEYAFSLNFEQVSLLTNGVTLSDKLKKLIVENRRRTFVQIDLQSLNDSYLSWFTGMSNTLHKIQNNITYFIEKGVLIRIATTVTNRNVNEIENIADWIYKKGIRHWAVSPVAAVGRAVDEKESLCINETNAILLDKSLKRIMGVYPGLLSIIDENRRAPINCGCLTTHIVISSEGDIKICTMDNLQYFNSSIGNILDENISDIYDKNKKFIYEFLRMPSPKSTRKECVNCTNVAFCNGCVLRGLIKAHEQGSKCSWYENAVSEIIKNKLDDNNPITLNVK